jgi:hypothetical protein
MRVQISNFKELHFHTVKEFPNPEHETKFPVSDGYKRWASRETVSGNPAVKEASLYYTL